MPNSEFDVAVIGGSYAGLSGAMTLARSLHNVLVVDAGRPCNQQTPHAHNLLTHDGSKPADIAAAARRQVAAYPSVEFWSGTLGEIHGEDGGFEGLVDGQRMFKAKKILLATGMHDELPEIEGFRDCWGISVLHCPYCHGYEMKGRRLGVLVNGEHASELALFIRHWSADNTVLLTNGPSTAPENTPELLERLGVGMIDAPVARIEHEEGWMSQVVFEDGHKEPFDAVFARVTMRQQGDLAASLGCKFTDTGHIAVDMFQKTSVDGIYAAGDCASPLRMLSMAMSSGNMAGAAINKSLIGAAI